MSERALMNKADICKAFARLHEGETYHLQKNYTDPVSGEEFEEGILVTIKEAVPDESVMKKIPKIYAGEEKDWEVSDFCFDYLVETNNKEQFQIKSYYLTDEKLKFITKNEKASAYRAYIIYRISKWVKFFSLGLLVSAGIRCLINQEITPFLIVFPVTQLIQIAIILAKTYNCETMFATKALFRYIKNDN